MCSFSQVMAQGEKRQKQVAAATEALAADPTNEALMADLKKRQTQV